MHNMHKPLLIYLGLLLTFTTGCSKKITEVVFDANRRFACNVRIFEPEKDTLLVLSEMPGNRTYSYHTIEQNDTATILKNVYRTTPKVSYLETTRDSSYRFIFVNEKGLEINNLSASFLVNDSLWCNNNIHEFELNTIYKLDTIASLSIQFGGIAFFEMNSLPKGESVFIVSNLHPDHSRGASEWYYGDYYLPSSTPIQLADTTTMRRSTPFRSESIDINYFYMGTFDLKKRDFNRWFGWTNGIRKKP